jgi:hypothetical protein
MMNMAFELWVDGGMSGNIQIWLIEQATIAA